jgi:hypothetical protein
VWAQHAADKAQPGTKVSDVTFAGASWWAVECTNLCLSFQQQQTPLYLAAAAL